MKIARRLALLACLLGLSWPLAAAEPTTPVPGQVVATAPACPHPGRGIDLAQLSQADCCKGHKGVCGCRAGKIVCCDNSVSPSCTCRAEDPEFTP